MKKHNLGKAGSRCLDHGWQLTFNEVDFICQPPEFPLTVMADPVRLHQALDKLVENAVSFHVPGTAIELQIERMTESVILKVINQGTTIDPPMQQQIFNSMVSSRKTKDVQPHLGLGLYIVRTIMEHHNGTISVANLQDGRTGVAFSLTLPIL